MNVFYGALNFKSPPSSAGVGIATLRNIYIKRGNGETERRKVKVSRNCER